MDARKDFRLIVLTSPRTVPGEYRLVRSLFRAGLSRLHLRKPGMDSAALKAYLTRFTSAETGKISVHSSDPSLLETGIAGLHLPFRALGQGRASCSVSASVHSLEEYAKLNPAVEYAFIGPVYDSISKPGYLQRPDLWHVPAKKTVPRIALGGVCAGNILSLMKGGFDGAGLLGAIWGQPEKAVEQFISIKKLAGGSHES